MNTSTPDLSQLAQALSEQTGLPLETCQEQILLAADKARNSTTAGASPGGTIGGSLHIQSLAAALKTGQPAPRDPSVPGPDLAEAARSLSETAGIPLEEAQERVLLAAQKVSGA
jgi:hypothetical protein